MTTAEALVVLCAVELVDKVRRVKVNIFDGVAMHTSGFLYSTVGDLVETVESLERESHRGNQMQPLSDG